MTTSAIPHNASTPKTDSDSKTSTKSSTSTVSSEMFLQLLVAQLKNQDPLNPTDSSQFLTQLSQISQVEQLVAIRSDVDTIVDAATDTTAQA